MTSTGTQILDARACRACAAAKRRCGKQRPLCLRCRRKGIDCTYPPPKPSSFVLCGAADDTMSAGAAMLAFNPTPSTPSPCSPRATTDDGSLTLGLEVSGVDMGSGMGLGLGIFGAQPATLWFAGAETWEVDHGPLPGRTSFSFEDLKGVMATVHRWLAQFVKESSNPFIHPQLYRYRFPRSIQDAYAALSCHLNKTASNEQAIAQIIEDRVRELVEHGRATAAAGTRSATLDCLDHLARVQALLIYQLIGLYDCNIRLRHLAESHIPVLNSWMHQMVDHARCALSLDCAAILSCAEDDANTEASAGLSFSDLDIPGMHSDNLLWYSWILAESIRRTWLVASGVQGLYVTLQHRRARCMGAMMFTSRPGFWEARSAVHWMKQCSEVYGGLIRLTEADRLFAEAGPDEVNDFTMLVLQLSFGPERLERWGVENEE